MSTTNSRVAAIRQDVAQSYRELNALLDGPVGKLYAEKLYQVPTENEWTLMENLAHIAEFQVYWAKEAEKLVANPGQSFGRTREHEGRLAALREHGRDSLAQIRGMLPPSYAYLDAVLGKLTDSDLELTGHHSRFGEKTLEWFFGEFVTDHLRAHLEQIRACLQEIV